MTYSALPDGAILLPTTAGYANTKSLRVHRVPNGKTTFRFLDYQHVIRRFALFIASLGRNRKEPRGLLAVCRVALRIFVNVR